MSDRIKVLPIYPGLLGQAWQFVGPLLLRGQIECTPAKGTPGEQMQHSLLELLEFLKKAHKGECIIWSVIDEDKRKVVAAMISELFTDEGKTTLWVSRMAGEDIFSWGKALSKTMAAHAKDQGAETVRFWGRKALQRAYADPTLRIIDSMNGGIYLFEGTVI